MTTQNLQLVEPPDSAVPTIGPELRETFRVLDALGTGWMAVLSASTMSPPASPTPGDAYRVPDGATGLWSGHARHLAIWSQLGWIFRSPRPGWVSLVLDRNSPFGLAEQYTGTQWQPLQLTATNVSVFPVSGTDFASEDLAALIIEINHRFLANETDIDAAIAELADHEDRISTLEATSGGGGGSGIGAPATIDDLLFWFQADTLKASSGKIIPVLKNQAPSYGGNNGNQINGGATRGATQLNGQNVLTFPGTSAGRYGPAVNMPPLKTATIFAVLKPANFSQSAAIIAGVASSLILRLEQTTGKPQLQSTNVANIGIASTGLSTAAWQQINCTYDDSSGAYAFRRGGAADGSGSSAQTISSSFSTIAYRAISGGDQDYSGDLAELIVFNRVLSGTEITNVETYLSTKWGV